MRSRVRMFGHPLHPLLVAAPLGLFAAGALFDLGHVVTGNGTLAGVGYGYATAGATSAVLVAAAGLADWAATVRPARVRRVDARVGIANTVALVTFVLAWSVRALGSGTVPGWGSFALELAGLTVVAITASPGLILAPILTRQR